MADDKSKAPRAPEEQEQPEEKPARKLPLMKYGIIGGIVIVQIAASWFLQKTFIFDSPAQAEQAEAVETEQGHGEEEEGDEHGDAKSAGFEDATIVMLDEIIVNPAGTDGRRYLATRLGLQSQSKLAEEEIGARSVLIRDAVISLLSGKNITQLAALSYRDTLRTEIREVVNAQLTKCEVSNVVFSDYVLQ